MAKEKNVNKKKSPLSEWWGNLDDMTMLAMFAIFAIFVVTTIGLVAILQIIVFAIKLYEGGAL